jgi:hypothetical protein
MSQSAASSARTLQRDLGVFVACQHLVCAIPTEHVIRLILPSEATELTPGVLLVNRQSYAIWDLGERLGLTSAREAWCLVRIPYKAGGLLLAIGTGRCWSVSPLRETRSLPSQLFRDKRSAVRGAFAADPRHGGALLGIELNLSRLWSPAELKASETLLDVEGQG